MIKIRSEINEMETKKLQRINETKVDSLKRQKKIGKPWP
jgi:hypothetical protein